MRDKALRKTYYSNYVELISGIVLELLACAIVLIYGKRLETAIVQVLILIISLGVGLVMLLCGISGIYKFKKYVTDRVSMDVLDMEISNSATIWLPKLEIYLTPHYAIGTGAYILPFRYEDIQDWWINVSTTDYGEQYSLLIDSKEFGTEVLGCDTAIMYEQYKKEFEEEIALFEKAWMEQKELEF